MSKIQHLCLDHMRALDSCNDLDISSSGSAEDIDRAKENAIITGGIEASNAIKRNTKILRERQSRRD